MPGPPRLGSQLQAPDSKPTRWQPASAWHAYNSATGKVSRGNFPQGNTSQSFLGFLKSEAALRYPLFPARMTICGGGGVGRGFGSPARQGKGSFSSVLSQSWYLHDTPFEAPWAGGQSSLGEGVLAWAPAGEGSGSTTTTGGSD